MKPPVIYLHIGLHKTGTTSIQTFFFENRQRFLREGILYPKTGIPEEWEAQHELAWQINEDGRRMPGKDFWKDLGAEIALESPAKVIISSECFNEKFGAVQIERVRKKLAGHEVKIVVYLRRQDAWFESSYKQGVKEGRVYQSFREFSKSMHRQGMGNYSVLLSEWEKVFGRGNVIVRVYREKEPPGKLIEDFLEAVRINSPLAEYEPARALNISLDGKYLKVLRFFNGAACRAPLKVRRFYLRWMKKLFYQTIVRLPDRLISPQLAAPAELQEILKTCETSNQKLTHDYAGAAFDPA